MTMAHGLWADAAEWRESAARAVDALALLRTSHLVDRQEYAAAVGLAEPDAAEAHFLAVGAQEGRCPNPYFDTKWYCAENPEAASTNPLLHYILIGEAALRPPSPLFDLAWYASQHRPDAGRTLLAHYLSRRHGGEVSPMADFDPGYYLDRNPDVAAAGVDPFEHYINWGYREGRDPSPRFNTNFYIRRYLGGDYAENPLLHHRRTRDLVKRVTIPEDEASGLFAEARRSTRPGPDFEATLSLPVTARRRAKVLAFYLPQFHAIAENDRWWGAGFTEWTSLSRALPRFAGHYQPRIPRDLGHYALTDTKVMRRQAELALGAGIAGFVHYFYWFNGHRLLEGPTEAMLADSTIDIPFCLMWANENWTRRWDGSEQEVLIAQDWAGDDEPALIACFLRHMRDPRYIRLGGRALLMVYRPALIPDTKATVARWRAAFAAAGEAPILVMAQSFNALDPRDFGFDAAVEFPPHKLVGGLPRIGQTLDWYDPAATTQVYAYDDVVSASLAPELPDYPLIKTAVPGWDNEARRQGHGLVLHGATPAAYEAWLAALVERASAHRLEGEALVCINAWNEWAEGAYLEPDVHNGRVVPPGVV